MNKIKIKDLSTLIADLKVDYFFTSASFEERCFSISSEIKDFDFKKVIFFNSNELESIIENSKLLEKRLGAKASREELVTDEPIFNYVKIYNLVKKLGDGSKPNIFIDITTFTHETLLIFIRVLHFHKEDLGKIFVSYLGAEEYSVNEEGDDKWLSKGIEEIRTVIGYPGFSDPTKDNHLLILFGFESERTKRLINEFEFDHVSLGFANVENSIQANHQVINAKRHQNLVKEYNAKTFEFSLIDINSVKNDILKYLSKEEFQEMNIVISPMNNKISTIGAGLAAIENENIQITYAKPSIYNVEGYSTPNEDIYFSELNF